MYEDEEGYSDSDEEYSDYEDDGMVVPGTWYRHRIYMYVYISNVAFSVSQITLLSYMKTMQRC